MGATSESNWSGEIGADASCEDDDCAAVCMGNQANANASPRPIPMAHSTASAVRVTLCVSRDFEVMVVASHGLSKTFDRSGRSGDAAGAPEGAPRACV